MKIYYLIIIFIFNFSITNAQDFKLIKIIDGLKSPWSLSFINQNEALITEKSGNIIYIDIQKTELQNIKHNLKILEYGQGGLLDILFKNKDVYVSYSEDRGNWHTSTSVAKGKFNKNNIKFKSIFRAEPSIESQYHFGSRLVIKDKYLFITAGERGKGMIAQDPSKHPGSIIRINLDGSIPKDNPKFKNKKNWLPEIFQIGVRNPQGMALSPFNNKIYITGAIGSQHFSASIRRDPIHEAFGFPYDLPNARAYNETCANIGQAMWAQRMLCITCDSKYADVIVISPFEFVNNEKPCKEIINNVNIF